MAHLYILQLLHIVALKKVSVRWVRFTLIYFDWYKHKSSHYNHEQQHQVLLAIRAERIQIEVRSRPAKFHINRKYLGQVHDNHQEFQSNCFPTGTVRDAPRRVTYCHACRLRNSVKLAPATRKAISCSCEKINFQCLRVSGRGGGGWRLAYLNPHDIKNYPKNKVQNHQRDHRLHLVLALVNARIISIREHLSRTYTHKWKAAHWDMIWKSRR
jgi:hypothetical protein